MNSGVICDMFLFLSKITNKLVFAKKNTNDALLLSHDNGGNAMHWHTKHTAQKQHKPLEFTASLLSIGTERNHA